MKTITAVLFALLFTGCTLETPVVDLPKVEEENADTVKELTHFKGALAGGNTSGVIELWIAGEVTLPAAAPFIALAAASLDVTGAVDFTDSTSVEVSGAYDSAANHIDVSGDGYALDASLTTDGMLGTLTGPGGVNASVTLFKVAAGATAETVRVFCGTWGENAGAYGGIWNMVLNTSEGKVSGVSSFTYGGDDGGDGGAFYGTLSGNAIAISGEWGTASGALSGSSLSGTWNSNGDTGTWQGSEDGC